MFDTGPATVSFCALFVFLIETPSVADTLEVSVNVKLPFLFVIVIAPSDVLTSDAISVLAPVVVILIFYQSLLLMYYPKHLLLHL